MADRGSEHERSLLETLALAGVGALALAAERVDDLADAVASQLHVDLDGVRVALSRRRGPAGSGLDLCGRTDQDLTPLEDLELRVAQLEHRLRLLERSR